MRSSVDWREFVLILSFILLNVCFIMCVQRGYFMGNKVYEKRDDLLGKEFETKKCGRCFIINYKNYNDVLVSFYEPFCIVKCNLASLQKGHVSNPMFPTVLRKGYIGLGRYNSKNCGRIYKLWEGVMRRCLGNKCVSYKNVTICDEWLNFQNFAAWCESQEFFNAKDDRGKSYHLDKDILVRGNKRYSPEFCRFVPSSINNLILSSKSARGMHPIGVSVKNGKFFSQITGGCSEKKSTLILGYFDTPEEAFLSYKEVKELYIKDVANKWKDSIDVEIYESLMKWCVDKED